MPAAGKQQRTMQFFPAAHLLFIQQGGKSSGYVVEANDDGSVQLEKADGTVYTVSRVGDQTECDCPAGEFRGRCKHADAVKKLRELGKI